jgi:hypothetical protein
VIDVVDSPDRGSARRIRVNPFARCRQIRRNDALMALREGVFDMRNEVDS